MSLRNVAIAALLALAGCCPWDDDALCEEEDETLEEPGDCRQAREACVRSCVEAGDFRKYVDATCVGGRHRCPAGYVKVSDCED